MAHSVDSLRCEGSDAIGAKRTCRERRKRVDLTKMTHLGSRASEFAVMHNVAFIQRCGMLDPQPGMLMRRREFITILGGAASASMTRPYMAHGQTNRVRRVGILLAGSENDLEFQAQISALKKGLQELGWTEGRNVRFEYRWPGDDPERTRAYAAEIVGLAPDVIVTGTTPAAVVMRRETRSIPVVFVNLADPVGTGLVASLEPGAVIHRVPIIKAVARHRLPAVYPFRFFATDGGLAAYGVSLVDQYRRAASYVDRILRGTNPSDLPVQAPDKFELIFNLKTARAQGIDISPVLLARADEVIE
jgi:ABC-type uncharacterized transport system substrate-binding protein